MKLSRLGPAVACFVIVSLLVTAPARLLPLILPAGVASLDGLSGTVWRGSAGRTLVRAGAGYVHLGRVEWSLSPLSLVTLNPRLSLSSHWGNQSAMGDLILRGREDMELRDFTASVPANLVRYFVPVGLQGNVSARFEYLRLQEGLPYRAQGSLVWERAGWQSPTGPQSLGSYAVELSQDPGEDLSAELLTLTGPVQLSGGARLQGQDYEVDILVAGSGPLDTQLQQALSLVASPEGNAYRLSLHGRL